MATMRSRAFYLMGQKVEERTTGLETTRYSV